MSIHRQTDKQDKQIDVRFARGLRSSSCFEVTNTLLFSLDQRASQTATLADESRDKVASIHRLWCSSPCPTYVSLRPSPPFLPAPHPDRNRIEPMERLPVNDPSGPGPQGNPPQGPPSQGNLGPMSHGPPQLPPQMFTTAAQLLDLTDSGSNIALVFAWKLIPFQRS